MKRNRIWIGLGLLAAVCMLVFAALEWIGMGAGSILNFPVTPLALGLQKLSLSGSIGNIAAWVLFVLCGALPLIGVYTHRRGLRFAPEDAWLWIGSAFLYLGLYGQINPGMWSKMVLGPMMGMLHVAMAWIAFAAFAVLRVRKKAQQASSGKLAHLMKLLAAGFMVLCVVEAFGLGTAEVLAQWTNLLAANTDPHVNLIPTQGMLIAGWVVRIACCGMDIYAALAAQELFSVWEDKEDLRVQAANRLADTAGRMLTCTAMLTAAYQGVQVLLAAWLHELQLHMTLPLYSMMALAAVVLLARLLTSHKELREENEGFI